jgi:outer membrane protein assembly factor BamB
MWRILRSGAGTPSALSPVMQLRRILSSMVCVSAVFQLASAADWPNWRGVDRDDISKETGLLKEWPEAGPKKLWTTDVAGLGYSGYAVVKGVLYTMGLEDGLEYLIAIDAKDGKRKWKLEVGPQLSNNWGDGPRGTPSVVGEFVYAVSGQGNVVCAGVAEGKKVWDADLKKFGGKVPGWGYTESPLVEGNLLIVTPGGKEGTLLALDLKTGAKVWQSTGWEDGAHYSSPIAVTHNGVRQVIQLTSQNVAGVDVKDGKVLWKSAWPGKTAVIPTPIFKDGFVYITSGYGVGCKQIKVGPNHAVEEVWGINTNMVNHHGGVILVGDALYGYSDKGGWTCQDWKTGEVVWAEKKLGKGAVHCADGRLYLLDESNGTVALIEATREGWKESGRFKLDPQTTQRKPSGRVWTHPVVSDGKLYLRDQELISCFDVKASK